MPYRDSNVGTPTWPGAGDDDAADFLVDVIQPFLTDAKVSGGLGWISQTPDAGAGGAGAFPNYQRLYSRGSIGSEQWRPALPASNGVRCLRYLRAESGDEQQPARLRGARHGPCLVRDPRVQQR